MMKFCACICSDDTLRTQKLETRKLSSDKEKKSEKSEFLYTAKASLFVHCQSFMLLGGLFVSRDVVLSFVVFRHFNGFFIVLRKCHMLCRMWRGVAV